jgi:hypothetical protein
VAEGTLFAAPVGTAVAFSVGMGSLLVVGVAGTTVATMAVGLPVAVAGMVFKCPHSGVVHATRQIRTINRKRGFCVFMDKSVA